MLIDITLFTENQSRSEREVKTVFISDVLSRRGWREGYPNCSGGEPNYEKVKMNVSLKYSA